MREPEDVFAADLYYHSYFCKDYFNKYNATIEEILKNLDAEDSVTASDESLKAQFLALGLNFDSTAHSLTSIRDTLNENVTVPVSSRTIERVIIELYGDSVCFTYPNNKRVSQMVFSTKCNPVSLVESMRISPVQQVATELGQELKDYKFGLERSFSEPQDLQLSVMYVNLV